jgi:hypothetical protein
MRPAQHGASTEFGAIIGSQDTGQAALVRQPVEHPGDGETPERPRRAMEQLEAHRTENLAQSLHTGPEDAQDVVHEPEQTPASKSKPF